MRKQFLGIHQICSIVIKPTDEYEVMELITRLDCYKTPAYLDIPTILIEESKFLILNHLARLFNI